MCVYSPLFVLFIVCGESCGMGYINKLCLRIFFHVIFVKHIKWMKIFCCMSFIMSVYRFWCLFFLWCGMVFLYFKGEVGGDSNKQQFYTHL